MECSCLCDSYDRIFFLWIDVLHQGVPLHQHVREGRRGEDTNNLKHSSFDFYFVRF